MSATILIGGKTSGIVGTSLQTEIGKTGSAINHTLGLIQTDIDAAPVAGLSHNHITFPS